ncbi:unnamed protein product [Prunus armeniaca]|uniref:Transmembrane protein n=1 Tax=Prunus armeniaca TaxID=36596 RepID=A0A6J5VVH5_PRUAR|nr:unnamed protein product [Prunus armeniaca]
MAHGTSLMAISLKSHNFSFPPLTTMILLHPTLTMLFGFNNINLRFKTPAFTISPQFPPSLSWLSNLPTLPKNMVVFLTGALEVVLVAVVIVLFMMVVAISN